jgi:hypothetical protein
LSRPHIGCCFLSFSTARTSLVWGGGRCEGEWTCEQSASASARVSSAACPRPLPPAPP